MKLDFSKKYMDIGTFPFAFMRTLGVAATGGAEFNECLIVAEKIKNNNAESWTAEWAIIAERASRKAECAAQSGQTRTACEAYLRASNYYRSAMLPLPPSDSRLDKYLTLSREHFHKAAKLFSPPIEAVDIPMGDARLPAYFLSAGRPDSPTLIAVNGGDSTNEELVHFIGFAAIERGWNCIVFEGPGQPSALQLNPGFYLRADYEVPVKAVVDYILQRNDVDANRIALIGYSLGAQLAVRAAILDKRICACISDGLVVDVYEAWHAVWPMMLQRAPPKIFDLIFGLFEKLSPQLHGLTNRFRGMMGVNKPHDIVEAWRPFNIAELAPQMECPLLLLFGEAEYEQSGDRVATSIFRFMSKLNNPISVHEFTYEDGWAATHCQIGAFSAAQAVIFGWLEKTVNKRDGSRSSVAQFDWKVANKYFHSAEMRELQKSIRIAVV